MSAATDHPGQGAAIRLRVAIQGGRQSFSDLALDRMLADAGAPAAERLYLASFAAAVAAVDEGAAERALLPIENTIAGSLNEVYALIADHGVAIVAEHLLPVEHCLAGHPEARRQDLRRVLSHPVALQQCSRLLGSLDGCTAESCPDTARAAEAAAAAGRTDTAAICSEACALRLGLRVLERDVADHRGNMTRFVLVAPRPAAEDPSRPGRTSLMLTVDNRQGSLARCLQVFAQRGLNLSKLESRRQAGTVGEYLFYLDVDAWAGAPDMAAALDDVRALANAFHLLGTYPAADR
jgi:chorismate mutase/prephenate dehydratase